MTERTEKQEHALSHWVDRFLDRVMLGDCWYTAVETGGWMLGATPQQRMNHEEKRKARGIKPGHLDWYVWQSSTGLYVQIELKVANRKPRKSQQDTMVLLARNNIRSAVCQTVPEVCAFLIDAGFDLHRNCPNIALEFHERYMAKRRAAA